jgi:hypothetical protein
MPQDKLNTQWSEDDHKEASSYTSDQQSTYNSQAQIGSRPKGNRATHDAQGNGNYPVTYVKPTQPPCDGNQFARNPYDPDNYLEVKIDRWDNEIPQDRLMHNEMQMGDKGRFGGNQYAEFQKNANDGYGVEIPHGQSAAFNTASTTWIDNSQANRGADWVENNSDSGITRPGSGAYSNANDGVNQTSTPPIMRNRGR